jgi:hypothetical protein
VGTQLSKEMKECASLKRLSDTVTYAMPTATQLLALSVLSAVYAVQQ